MFCMLKLRLYVFTNIYLCFVEYNFRKRKQSKIYYALLINAICRCIYSLRNVAVVWSNQLFHTGSKIIRSKNANTRN